MPACAATADLEHEAWPGDGDRGREPTGREVEREVATAGSPNTQGPHWRADCPARSARDAPTPRGRTPTPAADRETRAEREPASRKESTSSRKACAELQSTQRAAVPAEQDRRGRIAVGRGPRGRDEIPDRDLGADLGDDPVRGAHDGDQRGGSVGGCTRRATSPIRPIVSAFCTRTGGCPSDQGRAGSRTKRGSVDRPRGCG